MRELETGQDQGPRHRCSAIVAEAARLLITLGYEPLVRLTIRVRSVGCGRGLDVIEECLEYQVMKRLDPLTPDRLVLPGRAALKRVAQNGRAFGRPQLEPVLALQLIRPHHSGRTHGTRAIELFPKHQPGVVQTVSVQPGSRSDLLRPDTIEVRDECSDPLWRRRNSPLMTVPDLHPPLTSPFVHRDHGETQRSLSSSEKDTLPLAASISRPPAMPLTDSSSCYPSRAFRFPSPLGLGVLSALRPSRAPSRDTAGLSGSRCANRSPLVSWGTVIKRPSHLLGLRR